MVGGWLLSAGAVLSGGRVVVVVVAFLLGLGFGVVTWFLVGV